jgi:cellulose 1,4-beta-cellobiosidase
MHQKLAAIAALVATARAQCAGTLTAETHPKMSWQQCTAGRSCTTVNGQVTIDANWRWLHNSAGTNCYTGNEFDTSLCKDATSCASTCCVDGADYSGTYGASTSGNALTLKFVTQGPYSKNIGSRMYLMKDENTYQGFKLLGNEFTFDVDVSNLP